MINNKQIESNEIAPSQKSWQIAVSAGLLEMRTGLTMTVLQWERKTTEDWNEPMIQWLSITTNSSGGECMSVQYKHSTMQRGQQKTIQISRGSYI